MAWDAKSDKNQQEIMNDLRDAGAKVWDCHRYGGGFPDLLVMFRGRLLLMEVKSKGGRLNEKERYFYDQWQECMVVVYSSEEALEAIQRL